MVELFGPDGIRALDALARQRALYAFDFDGTLSPIVEQPGDARADAEIEALLGSLAQRVPTVLLTGRAADDLRHRIGFVPTHLVGNHGAEGLPGTNDVDHDAHRRVVQRWLVQLPMTLASNAATGILVEPKAYSLSIHYRAAPDHAQARRDIAAAIAALDPPPRIIEGKCVFNLLPEGAPDKGTALRALVAFERCDAAFFIGDDLTDEAAFDDAPPSWVTVRVGASAESHARYFIAEQHDIRRCLQVLLRALDTAR